MCCEIVSLGHTRGEVGGIQTADSGSINIRELTFIACGRHRDDSSSCKSSGRKLR